MKWISVDTPPVHNLHVEIAAWEGDNNPPFWHLSHAWYDVEHGKWVRKGGERWDIQYWRESESSLFKRVSEKGLLRRVVKAYDAFMLSDLDTHITNEAWRELCDIVHAIRVYLHE